MFKSKRWPKLLRSTFRTPWKQQMGKPWKTLENHLLLLVASADLSCVFAAFAHFEQRGFRVCRFPAVNLADVLCQRRVLQHQMEYHNDTPFCRLQNPSASLESSCHRVGQLLSWLCQRHLGPFYLQHFMHFAFDIFLLQIFKWRCSVDDHWPLRDGAFVRNSEASLFSFVDISFDRHERTESMPSNRCHQIS